MHCKPSFRMKNKEYFKGSFYILHVLHVQPHVQTCTNVQTTCTTSGCWHVKILSLLSHPSTKSSHPPEKTHFGRLYWVSVCVCFISERPAVPISGWKDAEFTSVCFAEKYIAQIFPSVHSTVNRQADQSHCLGPPDPFLLMTFSYIFTKQQSFYLTNHVCFKPTRAKQRFVDTERLTQQAVGISSSSTGAPWREGFPRCYFESRDP